MSEEIRNNSAISEIDELAVNDVDSFYPVVHSSERRIKHKKSKGFFDELFHSVNYMEYNDVVLFLGENNTYYRDTYYRFKAGKAVKWNWASFILGPAWFLWRKLYFIAALLLALDIALVWTPEYFAPVVIFLSIVMGTLGNNFLFYNILRNKKKADLCQGQKRPEYISKHSGVTNTLLVILILLVVGAIRYILPL